MAQSSETTTFQWQTLVIAVVLFIIGAMLAQFFLLSEEIEDTRSRNAKLSIAEILAKQQNAKLQPTSFANKQNQELHLAAQQLRSADPNQVNAQNQTNTKVVDMTGSQDYRMLMNKVQRMSLVGIIAHDNYKVAIIRAQGSDSKVYSENDFVGDSMIVSKVLDDSVMMQSSNDRAIQIELKLAETPLIGSAQASDNLLNLPTTQPKR